MTQPASKRLVTEAAASSTYGRIDTNFNVKNYGATGDGTTDDTIAIQATITAASASMPGTGYGTSFMAMALVFFPPGVYLCSGITNPGRIHLYGSGARLKANAAGTILTLSGESALVSGLMFDGNGVGTGANGIVAAALAHMYKVSDCRFQDFAGRAVLCDVTSNGIVTDIFAQNCLLNTGALSTYTGVVEMNGIDSIFANSEISASRATLSAGGFACALVVKGGNSWVRDVQAEISDVGVYVNVPTNAALKMSHVRADLNRGHGFIFAGGIGIITGCHSYRNGQETAFTYNGFQSTAGTFEFHGCTAEGGGGSTHFIGFNDTQNSDASKNSYVNCRSVAHNLKGFGTTNVGARVSFPGGSSTASAVATAALNVDQVTDLRMVNTGAFTVTSMTNGVNGQILRLYGDGFTTIQNNAGCVNVAGAGLLLVAGRVYQYVRQNSIWIQM